MKITKYFVSNGRASHQLSEAVSDALEKRDIFLRDNSNLIDEIETEDLKLQSVQSIIYAVIILSYYPKKEL